MRLLSGEFGQTLLALDITHMELLDVSVTYYILYMICSRLPVLAGIRALVLFLLSHMI